MNRMQMMSSIARDAGRRPVHRIHCTEARGRTLVQLRRDSSRRQHPRPKWSGAKLRDHLSRQVIEGGPHDHHRPQTSRDLPALAGVSYAPVRWPRPDHRLPVMTVTWSGQTREIGRQVSKRGQTIRSRKRMPLFRSSAPARRCAGIEALSLRMPGCWVLGMCAAPSTAPLADPSAGARCATAWPSISVTITSRFRQPAADRRSRAGIHLAPCGC